MFSGTSEFGWKSFAKNDDLESGLATVSGNLTAPVLLETLVVLLRLVILFGAFILHLPIQSDSYVCCSFLQPSIQQHTKSDFPRYPRQVVFFFFNIYIYI